MPEEMVEGFQLSKQQKRLWLAQGGGGAFISQCALLVEGGLDAAALREAFAALVSDHEILRTSFHSLVGMDVPVQVIDEGVKPPDFEVLDLSGRPDNQVEDEVERVLGEWRRRPFDFQQPPLLRCTLIKLAADKHVLLVSQPALCADAGSLAQLALKLGRRYEAAAGGDAVTEEPVQYVDFSEWQHELTQAEGAEGHKDYWRKQVAAAQSATQPALPFNKNHGPEGRDGRAAEGFRPRTLGFALGEGASAKIESVARRYEVSVESLLLACWQTLLWRITGAHDIVSGHLCDGRRIRHLRECLGLFGQYVPLRTRFDAKFRFSDILRQIHQAAKDNYTHQEYFTTHPAAEAGAARAESRLPLPVKFDFVEWPAGHTYAGVRFSLHTIYSCHDRYELRLSALRRNSTLAFELHYDEAAYPPEAVGRFAGEFKALVEDAVERTDFPVSELEVLGEDERRRLLVEWNDTGADYRRDVCLQQLFEEQVERTPESVAVVFGEEQLSFRELNARANRVAHHLRRQGVGPEVPVALCTGRSPETMVGLLGILKAGGAYVPLDAAQPPQRLAFMLEDARAPIVLTRRELAASLPEHGAHVVCLDECRESLERESVANPTANTTPENLAYVIYTSGSTGRPKGVMIRHRSVINLAGALFKAIYAHHPAPLRVGMNAPLSFDASVKQWVQLLAGHTLVIVPEEVRPSGDELLAFTEAQRVDALDCTPAQLKLMLGSASWQRQEHLPSMMLIGGEALDRETWAALGAQEGVAFYNVYGPTECTVDATAARAKGAGDTPTIGRPITNTGLYLLDEWLRPVPLGATGEIHIAGDGLARGYLHRPDLTAERFIPNSFAAEPGARLYRTGDLARFLPDGRVEFLGRRDHQVKVRGFRIELGEIEAALRKHPAVREAVAAVREDVPGDARLVAYVVPERRSRPEIEGRARYELPNGLAIVHQNKNETDYLYQEIFEQQTYLRHGLEVPEGACVFDVGANIGLFTLFVRQQARGARVFAFEPILPIFETLRRNVELYGGNVRLFRHGLSDKAGTASFTFYPRYSMMSGQSDYAHADDDAEVVKRYLANQRRAGEAGADVLLEHADEILAGRFEAQVYESQLRTLSEVIRAERVERIDLLKIDVQRAELDVLRGIEESDWDKIRQVVMEAHDAEGDESEGHLRQITSLLESHGFAVVAEQDEALRGTDRYNVYATRDAARMRAAAESRRDTAGQPSALANVAPLISSGALRDALKQELPEYMIPSHFVVLDEIPLMRNGKVNREALPRPDSQSVAGGANFVAPQTVMERTVAKIWQEALRVEKVGANDNFFELGGHSLLMAQVHSRLVAELGRQIPMVEMFQHPTVSSLAKHLSQARKEPRSLQPAQERAARQKEAMSRQQRAGRKVNTGV